MDGGQLLGLVVFVAVSVLGWRLFARLKVPAASVLGGMALVAAAGLLSAPLYLPSWLRFIMSVNLGISIGSRYDIRLNRALLRAVLLFILVIVCGSLLITALMTAMGIESGTALFASLLGGLTELAFLAQEFSFDSFEVSIFQLMRMCMMLILIPILAGKLPAAEKPAPALEKKKLQKPTVVDWIVIVGLSCLLVELLTLAHFPAGKMIGAAVATAVYSSIRKIKPRLNPIWHSSMLSLIGGSTGLSVTMASLLALPGLLLPLLGYLAAVALVTAIVFFLLRRVGRMDPRTALFSSSMGGLAPTIAMSETMGADSSIVSSFQVIRLFSVIALALVLGYVTQT